MNGVLVAMILSKSLAHAEDLSALLSRGEVNLLETFADGRLRQVTTMALVRAPVDKVWATLIDFASYDLWMPQVSRADVMQQDGNVIEAEWAISVVGPDVTYRGKYTLDPTSYSITGTWVSGALQGSRWDWKLDSTAAGTIVKRTVRVNVVDSNWVLRQFEDENHTLDYGLNSSVGVVEVRGLKAHLGVP